MKQVEFASDLAWPVGSYPAALERGGVRFMFHHREVNDGDVVGWHYRSLCGRTLVVLND